MATMVQAIRLALHVGEERLGVTDIFGEDVGPPLGGVFTQTQGLKKAWNTPLDERGVVGMAMGLALAGQRPVGEIQFCDYAFNTIDLLKIAGNTCWASAGDWNLPLVLRDDSWKGIATFHFITQTPQDCRCIGQVIHYWSHRLLGKDAPEKLRPALAQILADNDDAKVTDEFSGDDKDRDLLRCHDVLLARRLAALLDRLDFGFIPNQMMLSGQGVQPTVGPMSFLVPSCP